MLSDEEILRLPDAPDEAFVEFERLARQRLQDLLKAHEQDNVGWDDEIEYMSAVIGAAKVYGIQGLQAWVLPRDDQDAGSVYETFRRAVTHITIQLRLRNAQRTKACAVAFDPAAKMRLRHLLEQMREMVDKEMHLTTRKRDALYARIADLSAEIDSDWSRAESYGQLAIEIADTAGEVASKLEPLRKIMETIAGVFGKARRDQQAQLPAPKEPKRIPPPKPTKEAAQRDSDEKISF